MKPEKINVLITGVGGASVGESILLALGSSKLNTKIVGTNMTPLSPYLYELERGYLVPPANHEGYMDRIIEICEKEKIEVIIPGSEPELEIIARNKKLFTEKRIMLLTNDYEVIKNCYDKWLQYNFLKEKEVLCPYTVLDCDKEEIIQKKGFPLVIKPRRGSGSSNTYIVNDRKELEFYLEKLRREKIELVIQEYIGSEMGEYTIGIVVSKGKKIIGSIAMKRKLEGITKKISIKDKKREYILSTGISQGIFVNEPSILKNAEEIALKIGGVGPINIQARLTEKGLCVFEVNPRFSGTSSMRAGVGFNDVELVMRDLIFGEKIEKVDYKKDVFVFRGLKNFFIDKSKFDQLTKDKVRDNRYESE